MELVLCLVAMFAVVLIFLLPVSVLPWIIAGFVIFALGWLAVGMYW